MMPMPAVVRRRRASALLVIMLPLTCTEAGLPFGPSKRHSFPNGEKGN